MKIFITGASGFIGGQIVSKLCLKHDFVAMARSKESEELVKSYGATPVICKLGAVKKEHLADCEMVIHAAAFTKEWGSKKDYWQTTVEGTRQLLEIAKEAGIKKIIHISTEAILFTGKDLNEIDESYPYPSKSNFLYSESKLEAEKLALSMNNDDFQVSVIRPRLVWGPGDQTILPVVIDMVEKGKFMWINNGLNITSHTHIYNLVHGVDCLITNWHQNEIFFITDEETHSYKFFFTNYLETVGVNPSTKSIPKWFIRFLASLIEFLWKLLNIKVQPPLTRFSAYMLSSSFTISSKKASTLLGYKPIISFNEAIENLKKSNQNNIN
ncbi:MAG: hypothetical protein RLZZ236_714 [Bacteroidota bacterium]|jgi:nucleoside-diphosphate-sugar epimerase